MLSHFLNVFADALRQLNEGLGQVFRHVIDHKAADADIAQRRENPVRHPKSVNRHEQVICSFLQLLEWALLLEHYELVWIGDEVLAPVEVQIPIGEVYLLFFIFHFKGLLGAIRNAGPPSCLFRWQAEIDFIDCG